MSAQSVAKLLGEWLAPIDLADPTPAKAANPAKDEHSCGSQPDSGFCEGLRIPANLPFEPTLACADSQTFASIRKRGNRPDSQHLRESSQDSQDSQGFPLHMPVRTCGDCAHRLRRGTCAEPETAGLIPAGHGFGIVWAKPEHAASCAAFKPMATPRAQERPYWLSAVEADAAHLEPWNDAVIGLYTLRRSRLMRRGFTEQDAEDLAERLHLRDVQEDARALCLECRYLTGTTATAWRCGSHKSASVPRNLPGDLVTRLQQCTAFSNGGA